MSPPRCVRWALCLSVVGALALSTPRAASPCSRVSTGGIPLSWTGESWAQLVWGASPGEEAPREPWARRGRLTFFAPDGRFERHVSFRGPDLLQGRFFAAAIAADGSVWGWVSCSDWDTPIDRRCHRAVRVAPSGEVVEVGAEGATPWRNGTALEVTALDGTLRVRRASREPQVLRRPFEDDERLTSSPGWAALPSGELAVLWVGTREVVLERYAATGDRELRRAYPRSYRGGLGTQPPRDGAALALAGGRMFLASDGSVVLGAWQINPDCSPQHASTFVVLDPEGELRTWGSGTQASTIVLSSDDVLFVSRPQGESGLYDLEGHLVGEIEAVDPPGAELAAALAEEARRVSQDSDPSDWVRLYSYLRPEDVDRWIVEAWPANTGQLSDGLLRALGSELCARESTVAAEEVLKAFRREWNFTEQVEWLPVLAACLDEPPEDAARLVQQVMAREDPFAKKTAQAALDAWGLKPPSRSRDHLAEAWQLFQERGPSARISVEETQVRVGAHLLAALPEGETRWREVAEGRGGVAQRARALLRRSGIHLAPSMASLRDETCRSLAALGQGWSAAADPELRALSDVLLLAFGEGDRRREAARLQARAALDAELGLALGLALHRASRGCRGPLATLAGALPRWLEVSVADYLQQSSFQAPDDCRATSGHLSCAGLGVMRPESALASLLGRAGLEILLSRADEVSSAREPVLAWVVSNPQDELRDEDLLEVLRAPWLHERVLLRPAVDMLFVAHAHTVHSEVRSAAEAQFDRLIDEHGVRTALRARRQIGPDPDSARRLLARVRPADLAGFVETEDDLRRWLWLVREAGAWPAIAAPLEGMLPGPLGVSAALALAPLGNRRALDVLLDRGTAEWEDVVPGLRHYGVEAVERLVPHLDHEDPLRRSNVRRAVRLLGAPPSVRARLATEARAAVARAEVPELNALLLTAGRDRALAVAAVVLLEAAEPSAMPWQVQRQVDRGAPGFFALLGELAASSGEAARASRNLLERYAEHDPVARRELRAAMAPPRGQAP